MNVKNLAVITVRPQNTIIETLFGKDKGPDQRRYGHMKHINKSNGSRASPSKESRAISKSGNKSAA